ncbi:major tail protein [Halalkalibacter krulwichiae]|uniref:Phage major tail protein, phi13 family n=1 Tax=Halalkalibacter krulwichiae TaxID=199441 RepID=A0A1X9MHT1_9BACI|nr:major tail protein [Halalkalibacter krulwichiae]ARK32130.1 hypothetical protein BkAM31D_21050 [Halalkalibacter krulwichiae]
MALKGLKNLHYAKILSEDKDKTEYGPVKQLGPAIAFNIQPSINRGNLRAEDQVLFSDVQKGPMAVTLNTAYLEKEVEADILGKTIHENGLMSDNANDAAPYIAIGGQAESARGGSEFFWLYRVKFAPAEENKETKQDTPTYQTPSHSGEAIPRIHDGEEKLKAWDQDESIDSDVFKNWFNEVVDKNWVPEV